MAVRIYSRLALVASLLWACLPGPNFDAVCQTLAQAAHSVAQDQGRLDDRRLQASLRGYLGHKFQSEIDLVSVDSSSIQIEGRTSGQSLRLFLVEVPLSQEISGLHQFDFVTPLSADKGHFTVKVSRYLATASGRHDRLLSAWALAQKSSLGLTLLSHGRFADQIEPRSDLPEQRPRCKKGLAGVSGDGPLKDLDELGVCSITMNLPLDFLHSSPAPGDLPFSYNGVTYFADAGEIAGYDATLRYAAQRRIVVAAILLVPKVSAFSDRKIGRLMIYAGCDPAANYMMPDVTTEAGLRTYAAALTFLAERYTRADRRYGLIQDWIMHNEVDQGWTWTNAGDKSELTYMDLYNRSMRTMYLIARQYDPHARVFISLTHYWNSAGDARSYMPRQMLADLTRLSHAEGDYEWAVAYHPYPEALINPRTWEDGDANFGVNTPLITFKNIEVLNAWALRPENLYRGRPRTIFLSEQGFNSPDYSARSLEEQAAGLAYAWKKIEPLSAIEAMQYHNWIDNRAEGGLRIGLRKFPDERSDPMGRKPAWFLYRKLGTPEEDKASAFALPLIGIKAWSQAVDASVSGSSAAAR